MKIAILLLLLVLLSGCGNVKIIEYPNQTFTYKNVVHCNKTNYNPCWFYKHETFVLNSSYGYTYNTFEHWDKNFVLIYKKGFEETNQTYMNGSYEFSGGRESNLSFFKDYNTPSPDLMLSQSPITSDSIKIYINCSNNVTITFSYEHKTVELCEYFKEAI